MKNLKGPNTILSDGHWTMPFYTQRLTTKEWKQVLLGENDRIIYKGHMVQLKIKKLGSGVVEVYKYLPPKGYE